MSQDEILIIINEQVEDRIKIPITDFKNIVGKFYPATKQTLKELRIL